MSETCDFDCRFELKAEKDKAGVFTGVASTSDLDLQGDVVEPGAFEPIPKKRAPNGNMIPAVLMLRDHDRSQVIGGWTGFHQDKTELYVEGELMIDEVPKARETYALLQKGYLNGLSVGFHMRDKEGSWEIVRGKRHIKKANLQEISIVGFPANRQARVVSVKQQIDEWRQSLGLDPCDIAELLELFKADDNKPYGDTRYADPGYQDDGVKRYPIDTERHVRSAWSYINMPKNAAAYTRDQLAKIKARIIAAWKRLIDEDGPPQAQEAHERGELILGIDGFTKLTERAATEASGLLAILKGRGHGKR